MVPLFYKLKYNISFSYLVKEDSKRKFEFDNATSEQATTLVEVMIFTLKLHVFFIL